MAKSPSLPLKTLPLRTVLRTVPSGEIALEVGADGVYLQFACDCLDALPFCHAACCCLPGLVVKSTERELLPTDIEQSLQENPDGELELPRRADGWCRCNSPETRGCAIYSNRPGTCRDFHCTRGVDMRGWRLDIHRHLPE